MTHLANDLTAVAARVKRRFPDHTLDNIFPVCLPVYELRIRVTVLAEDPLSTTARFILRLSNLGIKHPTEIGRLLGISDEYVAGSTAELLSAGLVVQRTDLGIEITEHGKTILIEGGISYRPRNRHSKIPYDPLIKRIIDMDIGRLLDRDVVRKNALFVPRTNPRRPQLGSIRIGEFKDYDRSYGQRNDKTEIIEVSDIKDVKLRYRDDIVMVKLHTPNSNKPTFVAYRAQQYLEEETAAIQRLADQGVDLVPDEYKIDKSISWMSSQSTSKEESTILSSIDELHSASVLAEYDTAEAKATQGTTQSDKERADLTARIEKLEREKDNLANQLADREDSLKELTSGQVRLIKTDEHRHLLLDAIAKASSELTLVSAWIDPYAFDDQVRHSLYAAIQRGVTVRIAWGLGTRRRGPDAERNKAKGDAALRKLRQLVRGRGNQLIIKRTETHEKFIICDDLFCAHGSFNWLSYRGERDEGYRRETSCYSERQEDINLWKQNAATLFDT